jgi:hypothetical protein
MANAKSSSVTPSVFGDLHHDRSVVIDRVRQSNMRDVGVVGLEMGYRYDDNSLLFPGQMLYE